MHNAIGHLGCPLYLCQTVHSANNTFCHAVQVVELYKLQQVTAVAHVMATSNIEKARRSGARRAADGPIDRSTYFKRVGQNVVAVFLGRDFRKSQRASPPPHPW